jgi:hypothetical protein
VSVLAAALTSGHPHIGFIRSLGFSQEAGVIHDTFILPCNMYLTNGRNDIVRHLLTTDHDTLLMVDDDIGFTPEAAGQVLSHVTPEMPVVCGWYRGILEDNTFVPIVYELRKDEDDEPAFFQVSEDQMAIHPSEHHNGDPLIQVGGAGTGFMAIDRSLLEAMPATYSHPCEWFAQPVMGAKMVGEDLGFCARVAQLGFPMYVDRRARVLHYKEIAI